MKLKAFSQSLSDEIENLFATLGDNCLPEDAHRLDNEVDIRSLLEKVKNLDVDSDSDKQQKTS